MTLAELEELVKQLLGEVNTLKTSVATLTTQVSDDYLLKLQDVKISELSPLTFGDILQYGNDGKWHNVQASALGIGGGSGSGSTTLAGLSDVLIVGKYSGLILTYDGATGKWINKDAPKGDSVDLTNYLTKTEAEGTYFKLVGGTINGNVVVNGTLLVKEMITGEDNVLVHGGVTMYGE